MYRIEKKKYGYQLTFGGFMNEDEMKEWVQESRKELKSAPASFGIFVDMRTLKPLPPESQIPMQEGQKFYKEKGMVRSVVILASAITAMQFKRIAKDTGIYEWERYIDSSSVADWEAIGVKWLTDAIDPDS